MSIIVLKIKTLILFNMYHLNYYYNYYRVYENKKFLEVFIAVKFEECML